MSIAQVVKEVSEFSQHHFDVKFCDISHLLVISLNCAQCFLYRPLGILPPIFIFLYITDGMLVTSV